MALPLMPKATAVWLIDNTMLSFRQIAEFCGLHPLAIQGMADGEVDQNIVGLDPVANSQLTRAEIERCEKDTNANLVLRESAIPIQRQKKGAIKLQAAQRAKQERQKYLEYRQAATRIQVAARSRRVGELGATETPAAEGAQPQAGRHLPMHRTSEDEYSRHRDDRVAMPGPTCTHKGSQGLGHIANGSAS